MKTLTLLSVLFCASISLSYAGTNDTGVTKTTCSKSADALKREYVAPAKGEVKVEDKKESESKLKG